MAEESTPFRDFDVDEEGQDAREPSCSFRLGGREWQVKNAEDVPFGAVDRILGARNGGQDVVVEIGPFFQSVIVDEQVDDFMAMLADPRSKLTVGKVKPLLAYVAGIVLYGRPMTPVSDSGSGPAPTTQKSEAGSSSQVTARKRRAG